MLGAFCATARGQTVVVSPNILDPSAAEISDIDPADALTGVACPTVALCVAIDSYGSLVIGQSPPGVPYATSTPTITGTATPGQTLTANNGDWANTPTDYSYQWLSCIAGRCSPVQGATLPTYSVTDTDIGQIRVEITGSNPSGSSDPVLSSPVIVTSQPPGPAPEAAAGPFISGADLVGTTLTEAHAEWSNSPTQFNITWDRCNPNCNPIPGATGSTYTLTSADTNTRIEVQETAAGGTGGYGDATSAQTSIIQSPGGPVPSTLPRATGQAQVRATLTEKHAAWSGSPTKYFYQWYLCTPAGENCSPIPGATRRTYRIPSTDRGRTIAVSEAASNSTGRASSVASVPTGIIP